MTKYYPDTLLPVPGTTYVRPPPPRQHTYAIFRQERFVGWCEAGSAEDAIETWIDTPYSHGVKPRSMPGPWSAVEEGEARERGLI